MDRRILQIKDLRKIFPLRGGGSIEAVRDVSFEVGEGEIVSVIGPSGCGKSTILNMIANLIPPTDGEIIHPEGTEFRIGYVFQESRLLPWRNVVDNVTFGLEGSHGVASDRAADREGLKEIARRYINLVGLAGFESSYPYELSGGMQQRVALARGLAIDPAILLLDEPFGALDALTRGYLQEELLRIVTATQKTVLIVTHDIDEALLMSDQVLVMTPRPGKIRRIFPIPFPRPRKLAELAVDAEYSRIRSELLLLLRGEIAEISEG
jgi:ABC-type nitrate/sulfonate/bicarbonate transport system ATPase subunit